MGPLSNLITTSLSRNKEMGFLFFSSYFSRFVDKIGIGCRKVEGREATTYSGACDLEASWLVGVNFQPSVDSDS
jgi:hypothetical protein